MKNKAFVYVLLSGVFLSLASLVLAQEKPEIPAQDTPVAVSLDEENVSWVWGEVKAIDQSLSTVTVVYMDYQSDEEKDLLLSINSETKFEGVTDINSLKTGDTAGIDYEIRTGKNIAKNISVEKLEAIPEAASSEQPVSVTAADTTAGQKTQ